METIRIEEDIKVFYETAASFPEGVLAAHQKLHSLVPFSKERRYYGISRPENGHINYKAAAEELHAGEAEQFHCDSLVLVKGNYIAIRLQDYMKDITVIGKTFQQLLSQPGLDQQGYCIEQYIGDKDMICMIRLGEDK